MVHSNSKYSIFIVCHLIEVTQSYNQLLLVLSDGIT